ncbi:MAG: peptidoglycan DD-metalloendopeptidase family protein [Bacteroidales bacterium]|jgi:murein DD-endopeptidase MepM/ murein hydrolase activator NlpD|nr:peptidoglycan DD-metalloendopeptidase family protein [Bacteroidales bacterium]MDY0368736.1 peptidoglycan DD-metalloendopeptidase family protein [Bacteroidales bacterium]
MMRQYKQLLKLILVLSGITSCLVFTRCSPSQSGESSAEEQVYEPQYMFDILVDSLEIIQDQIGKNQFLADLLQQYGVPYATIDLLSRNFRDTFDVRRIRAGNNYFVMLTNDSLRQPKYFVYEINKSDYVVFSLSDSLYAYSGQKSVETHIEWAHGIIHSSLWNTIVGQGYDAELAIKLSDVYAWTVDFFGIQKYDNFELMYERKYIDGEAVGVGKILASRFNHYNKDQFAFYFEQDGEGDYFDEKGESLRRAFLKAPLKYSRISSHFTHSRYHPILKIHRPHHGVDYAAPTGTPVYAIGQGVVTRKGFQKGGAGNYLYIKHNSTYTTAYMHLQKFASGIQEGTRVTQGQLIGYVGSTGLATGPHLDFRFFKHGQPVNPLTVESPPAKPVEPQNMTAFANLVAEKQKELTDFINELNLAQSDEIASESDI